VAATDCEDREYAWSWSGRHGDGSSG